MNKKLVYVFCISLLFFFLAHWYVLTRLSQLLSPAAPLIGSIVQALVYIFGSAYPLGRLANWKLPGKAGDSLIIIGSYWLGFLFYAVLLLILLDAIFFLGRILHFLPEVMNAHHPAGAWLVIALSGAAVLLGALNTRDVQVRRLTLEINKQCAFNPLTLVCVSDIHLGLLVGKDRLNHLITLIDQLSPDLVVFPGDILDETVGVFADCRMADEFRRLSPRFGMYGCLGNHEYILGSAEKSVFQLKQAGITILRDEYRVIHDSFILVGRDDIIQSTFGEQRLDLSQILQGFSPELPVILLDHTPKDLRIAPACGVDLQLSGHTHRGQMFPFNIFTRKSFKVDWGYTKLGQCHTIVSSGFGTWGPPLRIGSKAEVLQITLKFSKNKA